VVPWYIGAGGKIRPARTRDFGEARVPTTQLLALLPKLNAVVLMGSKAQSAYRRLHIQTSPRTFVTIHPSPVVFAIRRDAKASIDGVLKEVARFVGC
jgi:uracil-DNA glycosylase